MVKRFLERFQLLRHQRAEECRDNFLGWLLFLAALVIVQDAYALITAHYLTWRAIVGSILILTFVVLHIRQSPWTWIVLLLLAIMALAQVPLVYASAQTHPISVRLLSVVFAAAIGIAAFA